LNSTPADEHKFLALVNENRNRILKVCRVYSRNPSDQKDFYQEIPFQIWVGCPDWAQFWGGMSTLQLP